MAAVVESSATSVQASDSLTITATEPSGAVEGDLLVAVHCADSDSSGPLTAPVGWTDEGDEVFGATSQICWIIRGASAPDLEWSSNSAQHHVVVIARISGHDPDAPLSNYSHIHGSAAPEPFPGSATVVDGSLVFSAFGGDGDAEPDAVPTGYTSAGYSNSAAGSGTCTAGMAYKALAEADFDAPLPWGTTSISARTYSWAVNALPVLPSTEGSAVIESWSTTVSGAVNVTSLEIDKPSGVVEGDLLLLLNTTDNAETITAPSGFTTEIDEVFLTKTTMHVSWKFAGASEPATYTSSSSGSEQRTAIMLRISNADPDAPIDVSAHDTSIGVPSCPDLMTTVDNALVLRLFAGGDGAWAGFPAGTVGLRNLTSTLFGGGWASGGIAAEVKEISGLISTEDWGTTIADSIGATISIAPASTASLVAQYLLAEASSGTVPTTCPDSVAGHDLSIDYATSDAEWTSNGAGNGLDFLSTSGNAVAKISDMSDPGSIGGQFDGATAGSLIVVARLDAGTSSQSRIMVLGEDSSNGDIAFLVSPTQVQLRWGYDTGSGAYGNFNHVVDGTDHVYHAVFDMSATLNDDRARLWIDGVEIPNAGTSGTFSETLAPQEAAYSLSLGNRADGVRGVDGAIWYTELCTGKYTTREIAASYAALLLDHDSGWRAGGEVSDGSFLVAIMGTML